MSTIELETHILSRVRMLPQALRSQVADYIDFLLQRYDEQDEHLDVINGQSGLEATVLPTMSGQVQSYVDITDWRSVVELVEDDGLRIYDPA